MLLASTRQAMDRATTAHFDTVVIGAGISGLACASRLLRHDGWRDPGKLCVLEARDRIGGRIEAINVAGSRLDTGANWIHGVGTTEKRNPLMDLLPDKRMRPLSGSVVFRSVDDDGSSRTEGERSSIDAENWTQVSAPGSSGASCKTNVGKDLVIPSESASELMSTMWTTIGSLHDLAHRTSSPDAKGLTMLKAIAHTSPFRDAFSSLDPAYHHTLRGLPQFIENIEAAPLAAVSSEHAQDSPGMSLLEFKIDDFDGEQVFLQDGYTPIVNEIAKELLQRQLVHNNVEVTCIDWAASPMTITTSTGATYTANDIVCTIPLGVLKEKGHGLFSPRRPRAKSDAIDSLGFGTLDKVFLIFDRPWWTEGPFASIIKKGLTKSPVANSKHDPDTFVGFTDVLPGLEVHEGGTSTNGNRVISLTNLESLTGYPVLSCFISCANAKYIEGLTEDKAGHLLRNKLTRWFGQETPVPRAVHITRWASDPFSRGSYTHMITGLSESTHREEFQKPASNSAGNTLRFAGEHTSSDHFATVHGALISGYDAADAIVKARAGTTKI